MKNKREVTFAAFEAVIRLVANCEVSQNQVKKVISICADLFGVQLQNGFSKHYVHSVFRTGLARDIPFSFEFNLK